MHFKSKGCADATGDDLDQGDGQGCYNATRTAMADVLTAWLATDPTGSGDPDLLIIGDLNAYAMEDPITALESAGYVDLVESTIGAGAYSYAYYGQAGYLDHALANSSMTAQVAGAAIWHINADEPRALDYNEEYKSPRQVESLYSEDAYRSSDHDPVIVGLELGVGLPHRRHLPLVIRLWVPRKTLSRSEGASEAAPRSHLAKCLSWWANDPPGRAAPGFLRQQVSPPPHLRKDILAEN
jgi:predicted extracellular nuclease